MKPTEAELWGKVDQAELVLKCVFLAGSFVSLLAVGVAACHLTRICS
jgi:hypothetical protein